MLKVDFTRSAADAIRKLPPSLTTLAVNTIEALLNIKGHPIEGDSPYPNAPSLHVLTRDDPGGRLRIVYYRKDGDDFLKILRVDHI